jgi:hypothetical protein
MISIEQALTIEDPWHGIEPCQDCGITHMPVWVHVNFDSAHPLAGELRRSRDELVENGHGGDEGYLYERAGVVCRARQTAQRALSAALDRLADAQDEDDVIQAVRLAPEALWKAFEESSILLVQLEQFEPVSRLEP